jgi:hypothetical protein
MELSEGRKSWRLCIKGEEEDVSDEVIVRIQGVLVKNNLVPKNVKRQGALSSDNYTTHANSAAQRTKLSS